MKKSRKERGAERDSHLDGEILLLKKGGRAHDDLTLQKGVGHLGIVSGHKIELAIAGKTQPFPVKSIEDERISLVFRKGILIHFGNSIEEGLFLKGHDEFEPVWANPEE